MLNDGGFQGHSPNEIVSKGIIECEHHAALSLYNYIYGI